MRILISSHFFHPSIGGIEQVGLMLANEFCLAGHEVRVVTTTRESDNEIFPFEVIRRPSISQLLKLVRWSEVFVHNNISLRTWWPLLLTRRPWVIAHYTWIARTDSTLDLRDRLKHFLTRFATNIAVSKSVARHLTVPSVIIGHPYRDDLFQRDRFGTRDADLIFVGRLFPEEGVDILLYALSLLRERKVRPKLTIVGKGPELGELQRAVEEFRLTSQVVFLGLRTGKALVNLLNRHRVIVVPSCWQGPCGLVALEGVACGCRAIVADSGGLTEAAGPLAVVFEHENAAALAAAIEHTLSEEFDWEKYWRLTEEHLRQYQAKAVANRYLEVLTNAVCRTDWPLRRGEG
jgi:glycosyltransferase involved in cell wall biosynthesis